MRGAAIITSFLYSFNWDKWTATLPPNECPTIISTESGINLFRYSAYCFGEKLIWKGTDLPNPGKSNVIYSKLESIFALRLITSALTSPSPPFKVLIVVVL